MLLAMPLSLLAKGLQGEDNYAARRDGSQGCLSEIHATLKQGHV